MIMTWLSVKAEKNKKSCFTGKNFLPVKQPVGPA